jgi:hypothetical protein
VILHERVQVIIVEGAQPGRRVDDREIVPLPDAVRRESETRIPDLSECRPGAQSFGDVEAGFQIGPKNPVRVREPTQECRLGLTER